MAEVDMFTVSRNGEVIAENVTDCNYVDDEVPMSGVYSYTVKSVTEGCESLPSGEYIVSVMKNYYDTLQASASVVERAVKIDWSAPESKGVFRYDDGKYVENIGSNTYNWAIVVPSELMLCDSSSKLSHLEMYDACEATYTFKIYNGEKVHDSFLIFTGSLETYNTNDFVRFELGELPFNPDKDLWIVAKSTGASTPSVPCCQYVGVPNSAMIKAGSKWVSALEYGMEYSWMLRAYTTNEKDLSSMTYNLYKNDNLLVSGLSDLTYTDNDAEGDVCYIVEALLNEKSISQSDTLCVNVPTDGLKKDLIFPNPVKDYLTVIVEDVVNVKIINVTGAVVFNQDTDGESFAIDMRPYDSGTYILQLTTETKVITEKIIVQ